VDFDWAAVQETQGMWRYADLLPVDDPIGISVASGGTPLIRSTQLDEYAGCTVFVKDESENPTGAYKDRGSAVGITHAVQQGHSWVGTVSYGNMAMSTAAHAASADLACLILVSTAIPPVRVELIDQYAPTILQVVGDYGELYYDALELRSQLDIDFINADPPTRIAGYKTAALEIQEWFAPDAPDAIVVPASAGGFASGIWKGLRDLKQADLINDLPRLYLVQTAAADPITTAFEEGVDEVSKLSEEETGETIAHSIGNPNPPSGNRALAAARRTGGRVLSVTDEEISDAKQVFAELGGFCVEPASATPLAGVQKLTRDGDIASDEAVVLIPTGTGFKEMGISDTPVSLETVNRTELKTKVADILTPN
jgi:threonine synthase